MRRMNNDKAIKTMEKESLERYLQKLLGVKFHKITLFTSLPYTGSANISDPRNIMIIDDLKRLTELNGGAVNN